MKPLTWKISIIRGKKNTNEWKTFLFKHALWCVFFIFYYLIYLQFRSFISFLLILFFLLHFCCWIVCSNAQQFSIWKSTFVWFDSHIVENLYMVYLCFKLNYTFLYYQHTNTNAWQIKLCVGACFNTASILHFISIYFHTFHFIYDICK